jgi:hypothetical protein
MLGKVIWPLLVKFELKRPGRRLSLFQSPIWPAGRERGGAGGWFCGTRRRGVAATAGTPAGSPTEAGGAIGAGAAATGCVVAVAVAGRPPDGVTVA